MVVTLRLGDRELHRHDIKKRRIALRVAKARGISVDQLNQFVAQNTKAPDLGLLGEPRVNVLKLNLALDQQFPKK